MSYVLITGASSGIGKQFAKKFAAKGLDLILVARSEDKLNSVKEEILIESSVDIKVFPCDLSLEDGPKKVHDYTSSNDLKVSCLINNAGFGSFGKFEDTDLARYQQMVNLNDKALVSMSYLYLEDFKKNGMGRIVNTASIASFMPGPYMSVYYASKAFVLSLSLALNEEFKDYNIKVTAICPAPTNTDFWKVAKVEMNNFKAKHLSRNTDELVDGSMKAIEENKPFYVDGWLYKLAAFSTRLLPRNVLAHIAGQVNKNLNDSKLQ